MPGLTDNQLAIDALNQAIVALNELVDGSPGDQSVLIGDIANNIEAVRTEIETRSVAEVVAQNTNFQDLVGIIGALRLVCQSVTQVNQFNHFYPNIPAPQSGGGEGLPAPEPFEELPYDPIEHGTRKCFVATGLADEVPLVMRKWSAAGLDNATETSFKILFGLYVAAVSLAASESALIAGVMGTLDGTLLLLVNAAIAQSGNLDFVQIAQAFEDRREDMICAMMAASTTDEARSNVVAILTEEGVSLANKTYFASFYADGVLGHLFYSFEPVLEAEYQAATNIDCSFCGQSCAVYVHPANNIVSDDGTTIRVGAAQTFIGQGDAAYYVYIFFSVQPGPVQCEETFTVDNISVPSGTVTPHQPATWRLYTGLNGTFGNLWHSHSMPTAPISGCRSIVVKSVTDFDVQLDRTED